MSSILRARYDVVRIYRGSHYDGTLHKTYLGTMSHAFLSEWRSITIPSES